jgi:hypothetical protein
MATPFLLMLTEDAAGPEDDHHDQDPEQHGLRPLLAREESEATVVERLDDTDQHTTDDGTEQVADTAEHCRRERDEPEAEPGVVTGLAVDLDEHRAGCAGQCAAEDEHVGDHPVYVDAHQQGRVTVLRRGSHGLADLGLLHDPCHQQQQWNGDGDHDDVLDADLDRADGDRALRQHTRP